MVDGKEYNLDFRLILLFQYQIEELNIIPSYEDMGCDSFEEYNQIMKWLNKERWLDTQNETLKENLGLDEFKEHIEYRHKNRNFDLMKDWDAYYVDFRRIYNIDLTEIDYLDWFKFTWLLSGLFEIEDTLSSRRAYVRGVDLSKLDKSMKSSIIQQRNLYALENSVIKNPFIGKEKPNGK